MDRESDEWTILQLVRMFYFLKYSINYIVQISNGFSMPFRFMVTSQYKTVTW